MDQTISHLDLVTEKRVNQIIKAQPMTRIAVAHLPDVVFDVKCRALIVAAVQA